VIVAASVGHVGRLVNTLPVGSECCTAVCVSASLCAVTLLLCVCL